jgi:hypothetical protein
MLYLDSLGDIDDITLEFAWQYEDGAIAQPAS